MNLEELLSTLEDRNEELYELMCDDQSGSYRWYVGARCELNRTMTLIKRHLIAHAVDKRKPCKTCNGKGEIPAPDGWAICRDCH